MQIINSTTSDIDTIFKFYDIAIAYQKTKFNKHWQGFDLDLVETEVKENRQYKVLVDGVIACVFAVTFNDAAIWGERDLSPSIYIHRIVTHTDFRGMNLVQYIIQWAVEYGSKNGKEFVRVDTWADNQKLIDHYSNNGFTFLGLTGEMNSANLPKHYDSIRLSLFEIGIKEYQQRQVLAGETV